MYHFFSNSFYTKEKFYQRGWANPFGLKPYVEKTAWNTAMKRPKNMVFKLKRCIHPLRKMKHRQIIEL